MKPILVIGVVGFVAFFLLIIFVASRFIKSATGTITEVSDQFEAQRQHALAKEHESALLKIAGSHEGWVSAVQLAGATDLTIAEAREYLEALVRQGSAEMEVDDAGQIRFHLRLA